MRKLLIIKTGTAVPEVKKQCGDFEDLIMPQLEVSRRDVIVTPVFEQKALPDPERIMAAIITGSDAMVTDHPGWCLDTSRWLLDAARQAVPVLGICFGHQLIAQTFGGVVDYHPKGEELGTVEIALTEEGQRDRLLQVLPQSFLGHETHTQTVFQPPPGARVTARNDFEPHQAFALNGLPVWGVQFHPEFTATVMRLYIQVEKDGLCGETLAREEHRFARALASVTENPYGRLLLKRFMEIAG